MRRDLAFTGFLFGVCLGITEAADGQLRTTTDTAVMLASPTLKPAGRKAIQDRIEAVHARFREKHGGVGPEQFGVQCCQITQIPSGAFVPVGDALWVALAYGYKYRQSGASVNAVVQLPSGVEIQFLDLYYYDADPVNDISAVLYAYSGGTPDSGPPAVDALTTTSSSGSPGYDYAYSPAFGLFYTVNNNVALDPAGAQLEITIVAPVASSDLRFKAVDLWWMRQVSPAPAVQTFNDVGPGDFGFQYIEALAAAGITGGCGGNNYCPNNPLTRAQMAVFIAKALGLYWPY
jgi:hypothetical protein